MDVQNRVDEAVRHAIEAAVWAPSVHNTQPWWFGTRTYGEEAVIGLHADHDRRLDVADPDGREMLISCGAALCTLRIALGKLGFTSEVQLLPEPESPGLLADLRFGGRAEVTLETSLLYEQIRARRTHRGAFRDTAIGAPILAALVSEARMERAHLEVVSDARTRTALAALTEAAQQVHRQNPAYVSEAVKWAPAPRSTRLDGVHETAYPREPVRTEPNFPMREFAHGQGWGATNEHGEAGVTGTVMVITTTGDEQTDWLAAGQALQRVLLRASVEGLSAALHTQALEIPELREFMRTRLFRGAHPQVLLRTVRRVAAEVTQKEC
jgi:nitroreductase